MKRIPWDILLALLAGIGMGLVYSWGISPLRVDNADPSALRADFKDDYRSAIAAAYAANNNLPRAQARLSLLKDSDPIAALNAQAQRMTGSSAGLQQANQVAALALALSDNPGDIPTVPTATEIIKNFDVTSTATSPPPPDDIPIVLTETQPAAGIQASQSPDTPRPTQTSPPTLGTPFVLRGQENICDTNLPDGLLQVLILNSNRRQMPGMKIIIAWDGGEERFFTGLKPELGNGYADYIMLPNIAYTVQLAAGSDVATGLTTPTCQTTSGDTFLGGIKLTFQQP